MEQSEQNIEGLSPQKSITLLKYHPGKRVCAVERHGYSGGSNATIVIGIPPDARRPLRLAFAPSGGAVTHTELGYFAVPKGYLEVKAYLRGFTPPDTTKKKRILQIIYFPQADIEEMERNKTPYTDPRSIHPDIFDFASQSLGATEWRWVEYPLRALAVQAAARARPDRGYYQHEGD